MKERIGFGIILSGSCLAALAVQNLRVIIPPLLDLPPSIRVLGSAATVTLTFVVLVLGFAFPRPVRLIWIPLVMGLLGFGVFLGLEGAVQREVFPAEQARLSEWALILCYGMGWASLAWGLAALVVALYSRLPRGESKSVFIKNGKYSTNIVIFVHGLTGNAETTWGKFPDLIATDPKLDDYDVFLWGNPTRAVGKMPDVWQAATQLETELRVRLHQYKTIVLVGHSLGGLVIRAMIINVLQNSRPDVISAVKHVVTFGTPNDGTELANVASLFNLSAQINDLKMNGKTVSALRAEWVNRVYAPTIQAGEERTKKKIPLTAVVGLEDNVVSFETARSFFRDPEPETVPGGHIGMKLPEDRNATSYLVILRILERARITINEDFDKFNDEQRKRWKEGADYFDSLGDCLDKIGQGLRRGYIDPVNKGNLYMYISCLLQSIGDLRCCAACDESLELHRKLLVEYYELLEKMASEERSSRWDRKAMSFADSLCEVAGCYHGMATQYRTMKNFPVQH